MEIIFFGVYGYLCEVYLGRVPTTDPVISSEISLDRKVVGLGLVPLRQDKHIFAFLVCEPGDRHLCLEGFIVPAILLTITIQEGL